MQSARSLRPLPSLRGFSPAYRELRSNECFDTLTTLSSVLRLRSGSRFRLLVSESSLQAIVFIAYVIPSALVYVRVLVMSFRRRKETFFFHISLSQVTLTLVPSFMSNLHAGCRRQSVNSDDHTQHDLLRLVVRVALPTGDERDGLQDVPDHRLRRSEQILPRFIHASTYCLIVAQCFGIFSMTLQRLVSVLRWRRTTVRVSIHIFSSPSHPLCEACNAEER